LDALDAKGVERSGSFLADGCVLVMNNAEPVAGREAVLSGRSACWSSFGNPQLELLTIYGTDHAFMLEAFNHYQRFDGKAVTLRAVALTDRNESGKAISVRLHTDTGPLFAQDAA
jgi:hypothetical protein